MVTVGHYLSQMVTVGHCWSLFVTVGNSWSLLATVSHSLSLYDIIFSVGESSPRKIDQIGKRLWVDERTRAIKVDMALFNADTQLLTSVSHVFEFTSVGIFQNTVRVFSFPLFYTPATAEFLRMCLFFMMVLTFYFVFKEVVQVRSTGLFVYLRDPLAWLNLLERETCLAIFIGFIVEIFYRQQAIQNVKNYLSTSEEQREYFDFSNVDSIANYITYMCCILAVVSFIKILYQTSTLASMSQFLELIPPAVKISYLVVITVVTYASFGYFIFSEIDDFSTFIKSVYTVTELVINPGLMNSLANSYTIIAPVYITITMSVMNWIIINYFITLLNEEYSRICTAMRMRMEGKKAFVLEEIIKYLATQKTVMFEAAEARDLPRREDKQPYDKGSVRTLPESDVVEFDFFEWANNVSL
ncbi:hypothetical protein Btru_055560 [Bulinus truncatus]|nr:hypothetical protein Btru_055560 [Bulinus truncatus]